jgi:hypothetical protein
MRPQIVPQRSLSEAECHRSIDEVDVLMVELVPELDVASGNDRNTSRKQKDAASEYGAQIYMASSNI